MTWQTLLNWYHTQTIFMSLNRYIQKNVYRSWGQSPFCHFGQTNKNTTWSSEKKRLVSLGDVSELSNMSICRLFCHWTCTIKIVLKIIIENIYWCSKSLTFIISVFQERRRCMDLQQSSWKRRLSWKFVILDWL
jgi:hypothetical protein